jgi:hypothetical protein
MSQALFCLLRCRRHGPPVLWPPPEGLPLHLAPSQVLPDSLLAPRPVVDISVHPWLGFYAEPGPYSCNLLLEILSVLPATLIRQLPGPLPAP